MYATQVNAKAADIKKLMCSLNKPNSWGQNMSEKKKTNK